MDNDPEPPKPKSPLILSKEREEELAKARSALLRWMAEKIVEELQDERRQSVMEPAPPESTTHATEPKPAVARTGKARAALKSSPSNPARRSQKPESET